MKNDNQSISEWLGECRHENLTQTRTSGHFWGVQYKCPDCGYKGNGHQSKYKERRLYDSDPSTWTELFVKIEEAGYILSERFTENLCNIVNVGALAMESGYHEIEVQYDELYLIVKATPAQKAKALTKAINESKGEEYVSK